GRKTPPARRKKWMLVFSSGFCLPISGDVREARAPKLLHVGRRPSRIAHPAVGDPGSKGRRVAWTTSFGFRGGRDTGRVRSPRIGPPLHRRPRRGRGWRRRPVVPGSSNRQDTTL